MSQNLLVRLSGFARIAPDSYSKLCSPILQSLYLRQLKEPLPLPTLRGLLRSLGQTAEVVSLGRVGDRGTNGIQMDIAGEFQEVGVLVDEDGFVPALE